jgi:hypothetical protein
MIAHTGSIQKWIERWAEIDAAKLRDKNRWRRTPKVKRLGETNKQPGAPIEEKRLQPTREELPVKVESRPAPSVSQLPGPPSVKPLAPRERSGIQRIEGCVCGTGLNCDACDEPS